MIDKIKEDIDDYFYSNLEIGMSKEMLFKLLDKNDVQTNIKEAFEIDEKPLNEQIEYWKKEYLELSVELENNKAIVEELKEFLNGSEKHDITPLFLSTKDICVVMNRKIQELEKKHLNKEVENG